LIRAIPDAIAGASNPLSAASTVCSPSAKQGKKNKNGKRTRHVIENKLSGPESEPNLNPNTTPV
jgi:hypothetical protein